MLFFFYRGPLAGPVVACAAITPENIPGIKDSKKITSEDERDILYEKIISSKNVRWAVAVVDAKRIDEINILQATLEAMSLASRSLISSPPFQPKGCRAKEASSKIYGCYVVCGGSGSSDDSKIEAGENNNNQFHAIVDGNKLPKDMPCESETMVKGDSLEYSIAAASILAKVTRDRLMREYDVLFPQFEFSRHKGYPTKVHKEKVFEYGASPIHRRTFAPLKKMIFDKDGKVVRK